MAIAETNGQRLVACGKYSDNNDTPTAEVERIIDEYFQPMHIADVTHYLTPGSVLDQEAVQRATSVYLVDRTIPMLPEVLSNDLCSLRPHDALGYYIIV